MERYIVSFTSFGKRLEHVEKMLQCIDKQTLINFEVCITLYKDDVKFITPELHHRINNGKLKLIVADIDLGPHLKYFYAMQQNPDAVVITIDDDRYYAPNTIEKLVEMHELHPNDIIANCAIKMRQYNNMLLPLSYWFQRLERNESSMIGLAEGFCGILYPAHIFKDLDKQVNRILKCKYDDDLFLKVLEIEHNIKVTATGNPVTTEANNIQEVMQYNLHNNQNKGNINRNNMCKLFEKELLMGFNK